VVGADIKDPQTNQIATLLRHRSNSAQGEQRVLRILDFGAGKGRLLATLRAESLDIRNWLDYYAYDVNQAHQAECAREVTEAYGNEAQQRVFDDLHNAGARIGEGTVDVVVACNVLHELDPDDWLSLFGPGGTVSGLIAPGGGLLIVEDYGIPIGERAHTFGFLLLNEPELCKLFDIDRQDRKDNLFSSATSDDPRYRDRLVAHFIGKTCLVRISPESRLEAIKKLRERMMDRLDRFRRSAEADRSGAGRSYALCAQLFANSSLWLRAQTGSESGAA
jgi:SAM-dependent methyltransferase